MCLMPSYYKSRVDRYKGVLIHLDAKRLVFASLDAFLRPCKTILVAFLTKATTFSKSAVPNTHGIRSILLITDKVP